MIVYHEVDIDFTNLLNKEVSVRFTWNDKPVDLSMAFLGRYDYCAVTVAYDEEMLVENKIVKLNEFFVGTTIATELSLDFIFFRSINKSRGFEITELGNDIKLHTVYFQDV